MTILNSKTIKELDRNASDSAVTQLQLASKQIEFIDSAAFQDLEDLEEINLSDNLLTELPEDIFGATSKVRRIDLSSNQLIALPINLFRSLSELREINVSDNQIDHIDPELFRYNVKLEIIQLANNKLHRIPSATIKKLKCLKELWLNENKLLELDVPSLIFSSKLTTLKLANNELADLLGFERFHKCFPVLSTISLSGNNIICRHMELIVECFKKTNIHIDGYNAKAGVHEDTVYGIKCVNNKHFFKTRNNSIKKIWRSKTNTHVEKNDKLIDVIYAASNAKSVTDPIHGQTPTSKDNSWGERSSQSQQSFESSNQSIDEPVFLLSPQKFPQPPPIPLSDPPVDEVEEVTITTSADSIFQDDIPIVKQTDSTEDLDEKFDQLFDNNVYEVSSTNELLIERMLHSLPAELSESEIKFNSTSLKSAIKQPQYSIMSDSVDEKFNQLLLNGSLDNTIESDTTIRQNIFKDLPSDPSLDEKFNEILFKDPKHTPHIVAAHKKPHVVPRSHNNNQHLIRKVIGFNPVLNNDHDTNGNDEAEEDKAEIVTKAQIKDIEERMQRKMMEAVAVEVQKMSKKNEELKVVQSELKTLQMNYQSLQETVNKLIEKMPK